MVSRQHDRDSTTTCNSTWRGSCGWSCSSIISETLCSCQAGAQSILEQDGGDFVRGGCEASRRPLPSHPHPTASLFHPSLTHLITNHRLMHTKTSVSRYRPTHETASARPSHTAVCFARFSQHGAKGRTDCCGLQRHRRRIPLREGQKGVPTSTRKPSCRSAMTPFQPYPGTATRKHCRRQPRSGSRRSPRPTTTTISTWRRTTKTN